MVERAKLTAKNCPLRAAARVYLAGEMHCRKDLQDRGTGRTLSQERAGRYDVTDCCGLFDD